MEYMKQLLTLIIAIIIVLKGFSQETNQYYTIKGRIISDSGQIMYATVGIAGENIGTISDHTGHFELEIPNTQLKKKLTISHIGYESLSLYLDSLIQLDTIVIEPGLCNRVRDEALNHNKSGSLTSKA